MSTPKAYLDHDFPLELPTKIDVVNMMVNFTDRYAIEAHGEWDALGLPRRGRVQLGPNHRTFDVGMFQQLECLDTVRRSYVTLYAESSGGGGTHVSDTSGQIEVERCLEIIRLAVLCAADTTLEPASVEPGPDGVLSASASGNLVVHKCHDSQQLRRAVLRNQETWQG